MNDLTIHSIDLSDGDLGRAVHLFDFPTYTWDGGIGRSTIATAFQWEDCGILMTVCGSWRRSAAWNPNPSHSNPETIRLGMGDLLRIGESAL